MTEFKKYSNIGITSCISAARSCSKFCDPGTEKPKIAVYAKVHAAREIVCMVFDKAAVGLSAVNSRIQKTDI